MNDTYKATETDLPGINGRIFVLDKNGQGSYCPFQQPMQAQTTLGVPALFRMPCHTGCHFATIKVASLLKNTDGSSKIKINDDNVAEPQYGQTYCVSCSGNVQEFELTEVIRKGEDSKIVTIGK